MKSTIISFHATEYNFGTAARLSSGRGSTFEEPEHLQMFKLLKCLGTRSSSSCRDPFLPRRLLQPNRPRKVPPSSLTPHPLPPPPPSPHLSLSALMQASLRPLLPCSDPNRLNPFPTLSPNPSHKAIYLNGKGQRFLHTIIAAAMTLPSPFSHSSRSSKPPGQSSGADTEVQTLT